MRIRLIKNKINLIKIYLGCLLMSVKNAKIRKKELKNMHISQMYIK